MPFHAFKILPVLLLFLAACQKDKIALRHFEEQDSGVAVDLTALWFTDSLHGFATGGTPWRKGVILSTEDGGRHWRTDTLVDVRLECVMACPEGDAFACGQSGLLLRRRPSDPWWRVLRTDWQQERACFFPAPQWGVVVSLEGESRTLGPDEPWLLDTMHSFSGQLEALWFSDSVTAYAVGLGWVLRSADAGQSWERLPYTGDFFRAVHFPTSEVGYICGNNGTLLKTTDGGRNWSEIRRGGALGKRHQPFTDVWFVTPERGYLVGENGLFWRSDDGGAHWEQVAEAPGDVDFSEVMVLPDGQGWAAGSGGRIFYFED